jgi:hypothetical protein
MQAIDQEKITSNSDINRGVCWAGGQSSKKSVDPSAEIRVWLAATGEQTEIDP